jgi:hypothetical protein
MLRKYPKISSSVLNDNKLSGSSISPDKQLLEVALKTMKKNSFLKLDIALGAATLALGAIMLRVTTSASAGCTGRSSRCLFIG